MEHSEKPPREHKAAANILRRLRTEGGSLSRLVGQLHPRRFNVKSIYNLLGETIKLEKLLDEFFTRIDLLKSEERLDPWLAKVLFVALILGHKEIPGTSKPVVTIKRYYKKHKDELDSLKQKIEENNKIQQPKYVRVNTLLLSTADAVRNFQNEGWNLIRCTSGSYNDYLKQLENLGEYDFIPDYHVKVVFAFPPKASFWECSMYNNGEIFIQNKATCLAGHLLAPTPNSTILDLCAAPGMKTTHLASIIKNEGTIYSVEQDEERCKTLRTFIETSKATCVQVLNKDAAKITKIDCPNVDYVIVDPSCSGSGMDRVANNDADYDFQSGRIKKLSAFQAKLLRHVLNEFRTAKRVVYSTCSLYPQENEEVIADVMKNHKGKYRLVSALEMLKNNWNNTGDLKYDEIGEKCLYARPESDYTCGFFIAVFEKFDDDTSPVNAESTKDSSALENKNGESGVDMDVKIKNKKRKHDELDQDNNDEAKLTKKKIKNTEETEIKLKKKKEKHMNVNACVVEPTNNLDNGMQVETKNNMKIEMSDSNIGDNSKIEKPRKKYKKIRELEISNTSDNVFQEMNLESDEKLSKKFEVTEDVEIFDNFDDHDSAEYCTDIVGKKIKSKKHKKRVGDAQILNSSENSKEDLISTDMKKIKQHEKLDDTLIVIDDNGFDDTLNENEHSPNTKKIKKKKNTDDKSLIVINDDDELSFTNAKKNKKQKKILSTIVIDNDSFRDCSIESLNVKKSRKQKNLEKSSVVIDLVDYDNEAKKNSKMIEEFTEVSLVKKKSKKRKNYEL